MVSFRHSALVMGFLRPMFYDLGSVNAWVLTTTSTLLVSASGLL